MKSTFYQLLARNTHWNPRPFPMTPAAVDRGWSKQMKALGHGDGYAEERGTLRDTMKIPN